MDTPQNITDKPVEPIAPEDNCKLSSIEKIDFVLKYLALPENRNKYRSIDEIRVGEMKFYNRLNSYESITREDIVRVVMKLKNENHVIESSKLPDYAPDELLYSTNLFKISFDGMMWL